MFFHLKSICYAVPHGGRFMCGTLVSEVGQVRRKEPKMMKDDDFFAIVMVVLLPGHQYGRDLCNGMLPALLQQSGYRLL